MSNDTIYNICLAIISTIMTVFFAIGIYQGTKEDLRKLEEREKRSGKV
jgi:hypothetical protein